jgi:urease accessory protein
MMDEPVLTEMCEATGSAGDQLVLPFESRQKARQRVALRSGQYARLKLPRGTVLRGGDMLRGSSDLLVEVVAAPEAVSTLRCKDARLLARAAYHLGNRHVWVQVGNGWIRYLSDHVLDEMLDVLGASVESEMAPFEPEAGAYSHNEHVDLAR